jgi:hypothetical protein
MNVLPMESQERVISALAEGSSIRSIERMTGVHRDTIMRLGVRCVLPPTTVHNSSADSGPSETRRVIYATWNKSSNNRLTVLRGESRMGA